MSDAAGPSGLYEHFYTVADLQAAIAYWEQLGFAESARGTLEPDVAEALYGVADGLESVRLSHRAGADLGHIRLQSWRGGAEPGLGHSPPLSIGSRWSGFYTEDILRLREAYTDDAAANGVDWQVNDLTRLFISEMTPSFLTPFVGIREFFLTGPEHRHAFLQRVGFDRPGFGMFAPGTPLSCSESTHGNIVVGDASTVGFYTDALGLVSQAPAQRLGADMPAIRKSMRLVDGDVFTVEVLVAEGVPSGFLRFYVAESDVENHLARSRPGHTGLCCYSYAYAADALTARRERVVAGGGERVSDVTRNEFGEASFTCFAPDGYFWAFVAR